MKKLKIYEDIGTEANDQTELNCYQDKLQEEDCQSHQKPSIDVWIIAKRLTRADYCY